MHSDNREISRRRRAAGDASDQAASAADPATNGAGPGDPAGMAPALLWLTGPDGTCTYLSQSWYEYTGQTEATGLGFGWLDAVHPDDRERSRRIFQEANATHRPFSFEYRIRDISGEYRWAIDAGQPRYGPDGEFIGYIGSVVDIHDRKMHEFELAAERSARAQLSSIVASSADAIYSYDFDGRMVTWNRAAEELYGYTAAEMIGESINRLVPPGRISESDQIISAIRAGGAIRELETVRSRRDGTTFDAVINASPVFGPDGAPASISVIVRDVTDRKRIEATLAETAISLTRERERLAVALRAAQLGAYEWRIGQEDVWWSPETYLLYGVDQGSFRPTVENFSALVHPDDRASLMQRTEESLASGAPFMHEYRFIRPDGEVRWVSNRSHVILDADGRPERITGVALDITARREADDALRESEERFRLATASGRVGVWTWDVEANRVTWSESLYKIHGLDPSAFGGTVEEFAALVHPEDAPRVRESIRRTLEEGTPYDLEFRAVRPDGEVIWVYTNAQLVRDKDGKPLSLAGATVDITDRKRAEIALRDSEERFRLLVQHSANIIWRTDPNGNFLGRQESWERFTGQSADEYMEGGGFSAVHPDDRDDVAAAWYDGLRSFRPFESEFRLRHHSGEYRYVWSRGIPLIGQDGSATEWVGYIEDVTDRRRAEDALRESEATLRAFYDNSPVCMGITEPTGNDVLHIYDNPATCAFFGVEPGATSNKWALADIGGDPGAVKRWLSAYAESEGSGQPVRFEYEFGPPEKKKWMSAAISPIGRGPSGRTRFCYIAEDITERKLAEQVLRESEQKFRALSEAVPAMVWVCRPDGTLIYLNRRWVEYTGQGPEDYQGFGWVEAVHPDDRAGVLALWEECRETGKVYEGECRYRDRNGEYRWHYFRGLPLRDASGRISAWYGTIIDIQETKEATEALRDSEAFNRALLAGSLVGMYVYDTDARRNLYINPQYTKLTGYTLDDLDAMSQDELAALFHPDDAAAVAEHIKRTIGNEPGNEFEIEYRFLTADGRWIWCLSRDSMLPPAAGLGRRIVGSFLDITERKRWEAELNSRAMQQRVVTDLGLAALQEPGLQELFDRAVRSVAETLGVEMCKVLELQPGGKEVALVSGVGWQDGLVGNARVGTGMDSQAGYTLYSNDAVIVDDLRTETRFSGPQLLHDHGVVSGLSCVIMGEGRPWGVLGAHTTNRRGFTRDDVAFLQSVANVLATSIRRSHAEQALRDSEEKFRAVADNIPQLAWMTDETGSIFWYNRRWYEYTGTTLEEAAGWGWQSVHHPDHVRRVTDKFRASIERGTYWEDTFPIRGADGRYRWFLSRAFAIRDERGKVVRWFGTNTDVTEELLAREALREARDRLEEKVAGRTRELRELADRLSAEVRERRAAEHQVKEILGRIVNIQEEERRRIGRNIHDDLGQHISALRINLASLAARGDGNEDLSAKVDLVTRIAADLDRAIDSVTWELRPGHIGQMGLSRSIEGLVESWSRRFGIPCDFHATESAGSDLPVDVQVQLFRIAQEALHNIYKHAGATRAGVMLEHRESVVRLVVEDDGVGFEPESASADGDGLGLVSMQERATAIGGKIEIESQPSAGTTVIVSIPNAANGQQKASVP